MKLIYIVDDNFEILQSVSRWLQMKKFEVRTFSGSQPLYAALSIIIPDAVILDINLNGEDGRHICSEIRSKYSPALPVILFSALFDSINEVKDECADDVIAKEAGLHELTKLLNEYIRIENE